MVSVLMLVKKIKGSNLVQEARENEGRMSFALSPFSEEHVGASDELNWKQCETAPI